MREKSVPKVLGDGLGDEVAGELERNSRQAPSAPLANVKCLQSEKNRPERLFRLEINVTEKCGSRAISAAFSATHYASALKREGTHFWRVSNLLGSG